MITWNRVAAILTALLSAGAPLSAQQPLGPLDQLAGKWALEGTIAGQKTTHDVDADWVLNRGYLRLHEVSREKDAKGAPAYEAIIFISWDRRAGEYSCLWLDSTSNQGLYPSVIARAKPAGNTIPFLFEVPDGSRIHTRFVYDSARQSWRWEIDDETAGKVEPFARVTLRRR